MRWRYWSDKHCDTSGGLFLSRVATFKENTGCNSGMQRFSVAERADGSIDRSRKKNRCTEAAKWCDASRYTVETQRHTKASDDVQRYWSKHALMALTALLAIQCFCGISLWQCHFNRCNSSNNKLNNNNNNNSMAILNSNVGDYTPEMSRSHLT